MVAFARPLALGLAALCLAVIAPAPAAAQEHMATPTPQSWSFAGIFGTYDRAALQRGFQVYTQVCSACHGMGYLAYRNLGQPGGPEFSEAQVGAIAAAVQVQDGPDDFGEMFTRPALPSDRFVSPFPNDAAARAANGGALPPDLSVIARARGIERGFPWWLIDVVSGYQEQGPDYIYALLNGYAEAPDDMEMQPGMNYNAYFPGHQVAMPPPLAEGLVEFADGTEASVPQMARDVASFLMWAAEPHLEARKRIGFQVMIFLGVFAVLLYLTKQKIWARVEH